MITLQTGRGITYAIGIDVGGTFIKSGIVSSKGKVLKELKRKSFAEVGPKQVISSIEKCITELRRGFKNNITGIGIGAAGVVHEGKVKYPPNFKGWKVVDLRKHFRDMFKTRVEVDNDANCAALAELNFGYGKKYKTFIFITLGTGIGGGIVLDGKLYKGEFGGAGEFGMMTINFGGPECLGGNQGAVEAYLGRRYFLDNERKLIRKLDRNTDFEDLTKLARKGNKTAKALYRKYGFYLGVGLTNYFNLMDTRTAILSGGISNADKFFIGECVKTIRQKSLPTIKKDFRVLRSKINNRAGILGAACLIFNS